MNKVILVGRLTKDPEVKTTQNQIAVCSFTIALDRKFKSASGERQADFINCVAWRQQAEFLGKFFQKGSRLGLVGSLQSRSYDDPTGKKVFVTEVVVEEIEFVESKSSQQQQAPHDLPQNEQPPVMTPPEYQQEPAMQASPAYQQDSSVQSPPAAAFYPSMDDDTTLPFDL